jgi:hypothetical protein
LQLAFYKPFQSFDWSTEMKRTFVALRRALSSFSRDRRGNVAIIFRDGDDSAYRFCRRIDRLQPRERAAHQRSKIRSIPPR